MNKKILTALGRSVEGFILIGLSVAFVMVLMAAWAASMKLKDTVAANAAVMNVEPAPLIELQNVRNLAEASIADSRAYFLMGSKAIFDKQKSEKEQFAAALAKFDHEYSLPEIGPIVKKIEALKVQEQELFDQGSDFREKGTESKIVGQFYQSKVAPVLAQINTHIDQMKKLHDDALAASRERARTAGLDAQNQIPKGMALLTQALALIFAAMALLVIRMLWVRSSHVRERNRLAEAARKSLLARDEVIAAVADDFKAPLQTLDDAADKLKAARTAAEIVENADLVKTTVYEMRHHVEDIVDQKKADLGELTLRMDQMKISDLFDEAQFLLQPLAKLKNMPLQFDTVNPSVLAYVDRERVMRVLSVLVGNSIKFGERHSRINVKVKADQQFVNVQVADSGPGIPEDRLAGIFDNFWQARRTRDEGAGVSLAAVKTIIEAHGGGVKAESNLNGGTTVSFSLPRRRPAGVQLKRPAPTPIRSIPRDNAEGPTA